MANQEFNKMRAVVVPLLAAVLLLASILFLPGKIVQAQTSSEGDAIGIRVIPNPNHYSVYRWYQSQGFSGAPQTLTVDGYEALRDGRTVYINAAHVNQEQKVIYTNIYLISYNQDSSSLTTDILGQIISHWKFNDNLADQVSTCSISVTKCDTDSDCASNQACSTANSTCQLKEAKSCVVDSDCPAGFFCGSLKAMVVRDLKRVGKIEEVREALARYKEVNGSYPLLSAGTYLPGKTTSLWPSWNEVFLPAIGVKNSVVDPINRFGACPGYDNKTCWNPETKQFAAGSGPALTLPVNSYALAYTSNQAGSSYSLCAVMESRDSSNPVLGYRLEPGVNDDNCVTATGIMAAGNLNNTAPRIVDLALKGVAGKEFNGFARAVDNEGDPITWSISTGGNWSSWSAAPILKGVSDINQKKIYAVKSGNAGTYPITLTVTDSKGSSSATTSNIIIESSSTFGQADEYTYRLDPTIPFSFSFYVSGETSVPNYSLSLVSGIDALRLPGIERSVVSDGVNRHKITYQGIISTSASTIFTEDKESIYRLTVNGVSSNFIIRIKMNPPTLDFNCETQSRLNHTYSCRLGINKQGNHTISYFAEGALPVGLSIKEDPIAEPGVFYLSGQTTALHTGQEVRIKAVNEYGNPTVKSFVLRVNDYCGDGIAQEPNMEGRGGIFNNGYEACDGMSNVATTAAGSSYKIQYACNTGVGEESPYPINSNNYCVFKSPLEGGGYCGDLYCQATYENISTCPYDCDPNYFGDAPSLPEGTLGDGNDTGACSGANSCPAGYDCVGNTCQLKCWDKVETAVSVLVKTGDATKNGVEYENYYYKNLTWTHERITFNSGFLSPVGATQSDVKICTQTNGDDFLKLSDAASQCQGYNVIRIDNPACGDLEVNKTHCPLGANDYVSPYTKVPGSDRCKAGTFNWNDRRQATCYGNRTVKRCVSNKCRITLGSTVEDGYINASGQCVKPVACVQGVCATGYTCQSGLCIPTPLSPTVSPTPATCPAGKYLSSGVCLTCAAGTYKTGTNSATSCTLCPSNSYCATGATVPTSCPAGYTSSAGSDTSSDCVAPSSGGSIGGTCIPMCPTTTGYCGSDGCGGTCPCETGLTCKSASEPICICNSECAYSPETSNSTHHYNCAQINSYCSPNGGWCGDGIRQASIYNQSGYAIPGEECDNGSSNITVGVEPLPKYYGTKTYCDKNCNLVTYKHYCGDGTCDIGLIGSTEYCGQLCASSSDTFNDCSCNNGCSCLKGKICSEGLCVSPPPLQVIPE